MIPSIEGLLVCAALLGAGYLLGSGLIIGLFASLPFGSTAWSALPALGGSTPLIYTLFVSLVLLRVALRRDVLRSLGTVLMTSVTAWVLLLLAVYSAAGAYLLPRLFAGRTTAFAPIEGVVVELPLGPVSGNITQTAYFLFGILAFFAFRVLLLNPASLRPVRDGFFVYMTVNTALGVIDLGSKLAGLGDVLAPIRTASYALLTEVEEAGFWRIAGGYSEASAFGGSSLVCLAFAYTYWRATGSALAFVLGLTVLVLLLLSTSSTAYVGFGVLTLIPVSSFLFAALRNRFGWQDLAVAGLAALILVVLLATYLASERLFDPALDLFQRMVLDKAQSDSGKERAYFNYKSLLSVLDTGGLGVGLGSSRSSSWVISVLAQLGVLGALAFGVLVAVIVRGMAGLTPAAGSGEIFAFASAVRAGVLAMLLAGCIAGGSADPGVLFFIALAAILACRTYVGPQQQFKEK